MPSKIFVILISLLVLTACNNGKPNIALQPFDGMSEVEVALVQKSLAENYSANVFILPSIPLPDNAFIQVKSPRYRADTLLRYLRRIKPDTIDYILGLTNKDISTTKKDKNGEVKKPASKYQDWGVFGLGFRPGESSVVSTFRLSKRRPVKRSQLIKVSNHEIGHNLGLPHCTDTENCVMRDAAETIRTLSLIEETLCRQCKAKV